MLLKRDNGFAVILGAVSRGVDRPPADVAIEVSREDVVEGRRIAEWPSGMHEISDTPTIRRAAR